MTLTPNPRVRVMVRVGKVRKPYPNFQMVLLSMTLFLHSFFSQVDILLNSTLIAASTNTYPYKALLETLLSYRVDAKKTQLTSALFYQDKPGRMDSGFRRRCRERGSG